MEFDQISIVAGLLISTLLVIFFFSSLKSSQKKHRYPPGPVGIPLIGHLHLLSSKATPPHQTLAELSKKHGPFMLLRFGSISTLVASTADAAKEILKTHDLVFASRPRTAYGECFSYDGADLVMAPYGEYWRSVRKICTLELFTAKRVESFRPLREAEMLVFLTTLREAKDTAVDIVEVLNSFTFNVILKMIMGKSYSNGKDKNQEAYKFWLLFNEALVASSNFHIGDCFPWLKWLDFSLPNMKRIGKGMDRFLQLQLDEHKAKFDKGRLNDFMDVLISIFENKEMGDTTIKAVAFDILGGGFETASTTVAWAMAELAQNPDITTKAQQELDSVIQSGERMVSETDLPRLNYLEAIVKETFRLHPPAPLLVPHQTTSQCTLDAGYVVDANTQALVNVYAIGRDPSIWEDPLKFKPERMMVEGGKVVEIGKSFEVLPFGFGRRGCPGLNLGMITVHFMLANLLYMFDWKKAEEVDLTESPAFTLHFARSPKLIPVARHT